MQTFYSNNTSSNISTKRQQILRQANCKSLSVTNLHSLKSNSYSNSLGPQPSYDLQDISLFRLPQTPSNINVTSFLTDNEKINNQEYGKTKFPNEQIHFSASEKSISLVIDETKIDVSEEQSSGYYSSYQSSSIDLVSSSGGSNGGDILLLNRQQSNSVGVANSSSKPTITKSIANSITIPPHHHYHTRYLSNFLHHKNTNLNKNHHSTISESKLTPPCTRLRHHQQMLAASASAANASSNDLDIDLIEND